MAWRRCPTVVGWQVVVAWRLPWSVANPKRPGGFATVLCDWSHFAAVVQQCKEGFHEHYKPHCKADPNIITQNSSTANSSESREASHCSKTKKKKGRKKSGVKTKMNIFTSCPPSMDFSFSFPTIQIVL
jgi:hypothetical protein